MNTTENMWEKCISVKETKPSAAAHSVDYELRRRLSLKCLAHSHSQKNYKKMIVLSKTSFKNYTDSLNILIQKLNTH